MKVSIKHSCNDVDRVKPKYSEKRLCQYSFVHQKSQWTGLGLQLGLHSERLATNHLRHGATYVIFFFLTIIPEGYKSLNTTLIILCCKMYITAEWQNRDGHGFFKQYTFHVLLATTRETWDWRILCVCVCVCQKNPNNANELMFLYQMYLVVP